VAETSNIPSIAAIHKRLFEIGDYDFITVTDRGKNAKQEQALTELMSGKARELLYGGAAGGAKSWTGATWLTFMCECFPGTRWFVGRDTLKSIRGSTWQTFQKVFKLYGIEGWKYNDKDHYILFGNGSRIDFMELKFYPTDDQYERFGSYEFTGGWIEEAGEVDFGAYDAIKSRIGRHMNDKYGIRPILFITCNPKKNWLYFHFYTPWRLKQLDKKKLFIQAFVDDNPNNESAYKEQLQSISDKVKRQRLLLGDWEYDDDPAALCQFDAIVDLFTNDHVKPVGERHISADLAMKGRDHFIAGSFIGSVCRIAIDEAESDGKTIEKKLKELMISDRIGHSQVIVDSDGLGAYLESYLKGIKEFHGGAQAVDKKEYVNLKSECGYKLAEIVNKRAMRIVCTEAQKQRIIEELSILKKDDVDADEKRKRIIKKELMKELLQRSPDFLDMLIMFCYFLVKKEVKAY
jgi:phage terminase large subunit